MLELYLKSLIRLNALNLFPFADGLNPGPFCP